MFDLLPIYNTFININTLFLVHNNNNNDNIEIEIEIEMSTVFNHIYIFSLQHLCTHTHLPHLIHHLR